MAVKFGEDGASNPFGDRDRAVSGAWRTSVRMSHQIGPTI
jgi:hypothetical protein